LYSGSIGHKQGIELLVAAARALEDSDLTFVICGEGPGRPALEEAARGLSNVIVRDIQPVRDLPDLLSLATVHLLPQISAAADLVLPSKLTNMLASGRPIVATAAAGTGLHYEVNQCGIATRPGSIAEFVAAISELLADPALRMRLGDEGRRKAEEALSLEKILSGFEDECRLVIGSGGRGAS
jgi:colanic acid biosynthesis glycosyl transferase WcaI